MTNYTYGGQSTPHAKELKKLKSPEQDSFLLKLGTYIADGINYDYQQRTEEIAIRDIVAYDAVNIDTSRFPLLKLYRQSDRFEAPTSSETKGIIAYCLTYPQQDRLPGLLKYMSKAINFMLDNYHYNHEDCLSNVLLGTREAEYRIQVSEVTNAIYPFLRFNFSFREQ